MITETLLNSLKSLFSSLGAKTSDSNYAVGLFDKTSGEPKGMMGMLDLASVLGVGNNFYVESTTIWSSGNNPSYATEHDYGFSVVFSHKIWKTRFIGIAAATDGWRVMGFGETIDGMIWKSV